MANWDDGLETSVRRAMFCRIVSVALISATLCIAAALLAWLFAVRGGLDISVRLEVILFVLGCWTMIAAVVISPAATGSHGTGAFSATVTPGMGIAQSIIRGLLVSLGPLLVLIAMALLTDALSFAQAILNWLCLCAAALAFSAFVQCWAVAVSGALVALILATLVILAPAVSGDVATKSLDGVIAGISKYVGTKDDNSAPDQQMEIDADTQPQPQSQAALADTPANTDTNARIHSPQKRRFKRLGLFCGDIMSSSLSISWPALLVWAVLALTCNGLCFVQSRRRVLRDGI